MKLLKWMNFSNVLHGFVESDTLLLHDSSKKLLYGFAKVATWIYLCCHIDLSSLFYVFLLPNKTKLKLKVDQYVKAF